MSVAHVSNVPLTHVGNVRHRDFGVTALHNVSRSIMIRSSWLMVIVAGAAGAMACGCSDSGAGRVTGSVKLDGKPVADAEVRFCPAEDPNSAGNSARTGSDGTFEL